MKSAKDNTIMDTLSSTKLWDSIKHFKCLILLDIGDWRITAVLALSKILEYYLERN